MRGFYQKVSQILEDIVREKYGLELEPPLWEVPSRQEFGDLSSMAAMKLASRLKRDPLGIAIDLKSQLEKKLKGVAEKIEIVKPAFINLFISHKELSQAMNQLLKEKDDFFRHSIKKKVLLEFVSANPTGPLSIAHGRQAVVGDVIANILEFFGNKVTREYYINDAGRQIELLAASVAARIKELKGEEFSFPQNGYQGQYVKDIAKECLGKKKIKLDKFVESHVLKLIKNELASLGIKFESWISQTKLIQEGEVDRAIAFMKKKELIYDDGGALWFSSTKFGDDKDRVIKKSDGELTYFTSDIAYHRDKLKRKYNQLINLWGPDHHGYIERVKAAIEALGYRRQILKVLIIQLVSIKTKERMSRRKGTAILLSDLVNEVGPDTARFYYLVRRNSSHLEFDIDLAKEVSFNNPLYYVQYCCARINSIYEKAGKRRFDPAFSKFLKEPEEFMLLRVLLQFFHCLEKAYYTLEPVFIIEYLKNLAAIFHKFYERKRVLVDDKNVSCARLNLLEATRIVLYCALNLLGIKPVKKM
ncbi:MAG: arginine--tRNA ligase [Candidatus Omnitrophota bacterium]|nr:MAG: arginine--tRNA ligase [Candidatus Omnitrophota bacterium]